MKVLELRRTPHRLRWLRLATATTVPLSASERQSGVVRGVIHQGSLGKGVYREALAVTDSLERAPHFTPVVYTCGVSVLQDLRRTTAVLDGL